MCEFTMSSYPFKTLDYLIETYRITEIILMVQEQKILKMFVKILKDRDFFFKIFVPILYISREKKDYLFIIIFKAS